MTIEREQQGCTNYPPEPYAPSTQHEICIGDVATVVTDRIAVDTQVPVVIQHHGDELQFDVYLTDRDGAPDWSLVIPIAELVDADSLLVREYGY